LEAAIRRTSARCDTAEPTRSNSPSWSRVEVNRALASLYRSGEIIPIYEKWFGPFASAGALVQAVYLLQSLPE
jgi:hypothetical protein